MCAIKVLYLGYSIDPASCVENKGISIAGNKMQLSLLKGLKKINPFPVDIISIMPTAPFPMTRRKWVGFSKKEIVDDITTTYVPFVNIPYIKQTMQILNTVLISLYWGLTNRTFANKTVYCYNYHPNVAIPAIVLKKIFKCKIICILADPLIDLDNRKGMRKLIWNVMEKASEFNIKKFDGIIAVNKNSIEKYAKSTPFIVVEGGIDIADVSSTPINLKVTSDNTLVILFSGALYDYNGIKLLIEAIKLIKEKSIRLYIYGDGPLKEYVINESNYDSRIVYKGFVANEIVMAAQKEADILINPRHTNEIISLYTFPSKLLEYMVSGTPVITTKINGITEEYLPYLFIVEHESPECLASVISRVGSIDKYQLRRLGEKAKRFILNNKNWDIQCKRIYDFSVSLFS